MSFRMTSVLAASVVALLGATTVAEARVDASSKQVRRLSGTNLLTNGSFEGSVAGWSSWNASLAVTSGGLVGTHAVRVSLSGRATGFAISTSPAPVESSAGGTVYRLAAAVRTEKTGRETCLRLREWSGGDVVGSAVSCVWTNRSWQRFPIVAYTAKASGRAISGDIFVRSSRRGDTFLADDVVMTAAATTESAPPPAEETTACTKYAAPGGSDSAAGTLAAPFRTAQTLVARLAAGETGCLLPGTYTENVTFRTGGAVGAPITLRSAGERATIVGRVWIADSANDVVVSGLRLDGRTAGPPSPTINGDRVTFRDNEVTNANTNICFVLGDGEGSYGIAVSPRIERNRIHNCGLLPATNHHHGIYVEASRGAIITGNVIYDNADRGIQLYPDAQNSVITGNILDGNGSGIIFSGDFGIASNGNDVRGNVITNSVLRYNVEAWYPAGNPIGTGNLFSSNCVWNGAKGNLDGQPGYSASGTVVADPLYVDRAAKNFTLRAGSPCAAVLGS